MKIHEAHEARAVGCQSATSPSTVQDDVPGQGEHWVPEGILRLTSQMRALPAKRLGAKSPLVRAWSTLRDNQGRLR